MDVRGDASFTLVVLKCRSVELPGARSQSLICTTIFYGWGLGRAFTLRSAACVGLALAIFALPTLGWRLVAPIDTMPAVADRDSPDWISDALTQIRHELILFLRTSVSFSRHPGRFAADWAASVGQKLNPLGFAATAFAVIATASTVNDRLYAGGPAQAGSLRTDILSWLLPFVYFVALGAIQHVVLRLSGSPRRLRDSCAMSLYAGGGPAMAMQLLYMVYAMFAFRFGWVLGCDTGDLSWSWGCRFLLLFALSSLVVFFVTLGTAQARLHGARAWKVVVATLVALVATGVFFGTIRPPGNYGLHFVLYIRHEAGHWSASPALQTTAR